jgi:hypothetical protein
MKILKYASTSRIQGRGYATRTNLFSNSTEQSPCSDADTRSAGHEMLPVLRYPKIHYSVHNSPPLDPILSHMNPVYILPSHFHMAHVIIL